MQFEAQKEQYTLIINQDEMTESPRVSCSNLGTMMCFHSRYNLGDKNDYSSPEEFMQSVVRENVPNKDIINYVKSGQSSDVKLEYNRSEQTWELKVYWHTFKEWDIEDTFDDPLSENEDIVTDTLVEKMHLPDLLKLSEKEVCMLPLYLYDHSGITMSTTEFSCKWDSSQVGWIYTSHSDILKEFNEKKITPELKQKATDLLEQEVSIYDSYLQGDCYSIDLFKGDELGFSVSGFIGDPMQLKSSVEGLLPKECTGITDNLKMLNTLPVKEENNKRTSVIGKLKEFAAGVKVQPSNNTPVLEGEPR